MRVAFDVSSTRGNKTGIGTFTENLILALRAYAPEIEIIELNGAASADQRTDRRIVREQLTLPTQARRQSAQVLHLTGFAAPLRRPCPTVLTVMDLIGAMFSRNFPPAARFYWSLYLPFTLRFADSLIALSEQTKRDVVRLTGVPVERVHVIPPGRDERFRPIDDRLGLQAVRAELNLPGRFFLFVSTLEPRKGIDTLIAAYAGIANQVSEDLVVVGKRGWSWEQLSAQVQRLGLTPRVHFANYIAAEKLPFLYNLARAFVFPSRYEGFGLPPLEALACGTPVICSNAASLPEVVGAAGILIPPDDADGFARAMLELAQDDSLHADLSARGLRQAEKFSWEHSARDTAAVYHDAHYA